KEEIQTLVHYPVPVHKQKGYENYASEARLPMTEKTCREILSLPMYPLLEEEDILKISDCIAKYERQNL
ncbi:DegT/DnrJ/EryC1/StrS family aminotransferase, partial [Candidatus Bathyarchaeota archaeon]|nr:DegT/DnrJ/EryC1/StrS family aminotransferase [Candidatus Bathyarchaeota archaeon]